MLYGRYFKLNDAPFAISEDPKFFYLTPTHGESIAKCEYAIRNKSGLAVVYGDYGTGKTTITNLLKDRFNDDNYVVAYMNNTKLTSDTALLKAIAEEFGLKPPRSKLDTYNQLQEFLATQVAQGRTPLLLLDEAQDLGNSIRADRDMFGTIKTLTNLRLETEKLIQIIMFGQLELIPMLKARPALLRRVAQFGILSPLTKEDTTAMLEHRWKIAGGRLPIPFGNDALTLLYETTKGLPADMIKGCDAALNHAYATRRKIATLKSAQHAIKEQYLDKDKEDDVE